MYSVFNKVLQSDMGKTIVRKYAPTLDAQSVLKDFETDTHSVRLTLLPSAVRSVPELKMVETMVQYMSLTHSSSGHFSITYVNIS